MLNKTVFERYSVSAQIHENDLSILYAGKDTQTSQAIFLTVIKSGIVPTVDFLSRFKSMPQVNSALAVKPLEAGDMDGQAVIVWEGVAGKSLADLTSDGIGLPLERCLELAGQLGSHIEALHNQKALQGVLLPEDVFLSDENVLRILNLGVWNATTLKSAPIPYLAPELMHGEHESVRSDIYSLGALLFKILTGQAPDADPFPSRLRADIPMDWDELVSKCLNPDPTRRVQSAAEFLGKLDEMKRATRLGKGNPLGMEDSLVGHTLGAYRLVERLGQGGMATVYKAYEAALDR
jgi:serine/threonine protein kinase